MATPERPGFTRMLPGHFSGAGALVGDAGEREEHVGEAVEVDDDERRKLDVALKAHDVPLGTPAHRARDMERGGLWRAAGNDERPEWGELRVAFVDGALELRDARLVDARLLEEVRHLLAVGRREERADGEEIALYSDEHFVDSGHHLDAARESEDGVELVDVAVGFHAQIVLGHAASPEQRRLPGVPGARIDLHGGKEYKRPPPGAPTCVASAMRTGELSTMEHPAKDITIIGGGPAGLFALFYAGMRGASAQIVDALPEPGGQLAALYPEKYVFDVAGYPKVLARDLVRALAEQAAQFGEPIHLAQRVTGLERHDGQFVLHTERGDYPSRAILIAAGIGAFSPRRLPQACAEPWYGKGIYDLVTDPQEFAGQRVVIICRGDAAFAWRRQAARGAAHVSLVHRSDRFRAHGATVSQFHAGVAAGRASLFTFHELVDVIEHAEGERFSHIVLKDIKAKTTRELEAD